MSIRLRSARPDDHDAIAGLPGLSATTRRLLAADLAGRHPRHVVVATDGDAAHDVVAVAMATRQPDEVHLLDLVVRPSHRRRGLATALLAEVAQRARDDGATAMTLEVRVSNRPARALYHARGFADHGVRPGYYRDGEDAHVLWHDDLARLATDARSTCGRVA